MSTAESAASILQDHVALWSTGEIGAGEVVSAAGDALVAGLDSPTLRMLAACTRAEADDRVQELLPEALGELGLTFYPFGGEAGQQAVARSLAARMLAGELTPHELASRIHERFGHELPLVERLAELDDEYDLSGMGYGDRATELINTEVTAEAWRLAADPGVPPDTPR